MLSLWKSICGEDMKIDIHTHTKKCKSGDAHTREISTADFCETILATDVRIIAITNHNVFDLKQFKEIVACLDLVSGDVQVWPGIELDIEEEGKRGHLLVIISPRLSEEFSKIVETITMESNPDSFTISIDNTVKEFDALGPLYIAHYQQKQPDISEVALEKLIASTANKRRVIKEVTNSISAGIYISHGYPSIYGSDVQDWKQYEKESNKLPDLRLPVESFEHFCLLLEKDPTTINTLLDKKTSETLTLKPFDDDSEVELKIYDDINVFFGSKGTGKSCLLKAIAKHFADKGIDSNVFESSNERLQVKYDLNGKCFTKNLEPFGINYCTDEIAYIKGAREVDVTSVSNYVNFFKAEHTNRNAKKLRLKDLDLEEESGPKRKFEDYNIAASKVQEFIGFIAESEPVKEITNPENLDELITSISELLKGLSVGKWAKFTEWKQAQLLNSAIRKVKHEVSRKTGAPPKPTDTGFRGYALNRIKIEANAREVIENIKVKIPEDVEYVGNLGVDKGDLDCKTTVVIQDGGITDSALNSVKGIKKSAPKKFVNALNNIIEKIYSMELFEAISELNNNSDLEDIKTVYELLLFKKYFSLNGSEYDPSNGESSMLLLQGELGTDKDVYILDEPEKSLGNEYINDVIVPLIKEKARAGKKVFISTHDANIAVRTLPYSSIYRCHGPKGYRTYIGNPFSNHLVNICDNKDRLDWKKVSMKTLEGGEEAFGERGKIYGNG